MGPSPAYSGRCSAGVNAWPASRNLNGKPSWTGRVQNCLVAGETAPPSPDTDEAFWAPSVLMVPKPSRLGFFLSRQCFDARRCDRSRGRRSSK